MDTVNMIGPGNYSELLGKAWTLQAKVGAAFGILGIIAQLRGFLNEEVMGGINKSAEKSIKELFNEDGMTKESVKKGWECVKCGRVYAPWMVRCPVCPGPKSVYPTKKWWNVEKERFEGDR